MTGNDLIVHLFLIEEIPMRPKNICDDCNYLWSPRGHDLSIKCPNPNCGSTNVRIYRGDFKLLWLILHLIVFSLIINSRSDLSLEGIVKSIQIKRGWGEPSQFDPDAYLVEAGLMFLLSASIYLIPVVYFAFKNVAKGKTADTIDESDSLANQVKKAKRKSTKSPANAAKASWQFEKRNDFGPKELRWDAFVSHASEDKDDFVRPLVNALKRKGLSIWFDEFTIKVGDSLRRSIDRGLANSRYGIVVISPNFLQKEWPQKELDALASQEFDGRKGLCCIILKNDIRSGCLFARLADFASVGHAERQHAIENCATNNRLDRL